LPDVEQEPGGLMFDLGEREAASSAGRRAEAWPSRISAASRMPITAVRSISATIRRSSSTVKERARRRWAV